MRIHWLKHVPFEGLGIIEPILKNKGHVLSSTFLYENEKFPRIKDIDWLIIMGGPMGVYDEKKYPWLKEEKTFIKEVISSGKTVLGICLGAQLIAEVLGAEVARNKYREIGWFDIERSPEAEDTELGRAMPENIKVFHWHGDTFSIPRGAKLLAGSKACQNQGFILDNRVVGFQFHLETTPQTAAALIENCREEIDGSRYVQTEERMLSDSRRFSSINQVMSSVLEVLEKQR